MIVEEDGTLSPPNYHNNKESASKQMHTEDPLALMMERKISLSLSLSLYLNLISLFLGIGEEPTVCRWTILSN